MYVVARSERSQGAPDIDRNKYTRKAPEKNLYSDQTDFFLLENLTNPTNYGILCVEQDPTVEQKKQIEMHDMICLIKRDAQTFQVGFVDHDGGYREELLPHAFLTDIQDHAAAYSLLNQFLWQRNGVLPGTDLQVARQKALRVYSKSESIDLSQECEAQYVIAFRKDSAEVLGSGVGYNAIGYEPYLNIGQLPQGMLVNFHVWERREKFYAPKNLPSGATFERQSAQRRHIFKASDPIVCLEVETLFFWETDRDILATKFGVKPHFVDHLFNQITQLEDTPANPKGFIKKTYHDWLEANRFPGNSLTFAEFSANVDALFTEREHYHTVAKQTVGHRPW